MSTDTGDKMQSYVENDQMWDWNSRWPFDISTQAINGCHANAEMSSYIGRRFSVFVLAPQFNNVAFGQFVVRASCAHRTTVDGAAFPQQESAARGARTEDSRANVHKNVLWYNVRPITINHPNTYTARQRGPKEPFRHDVSGLHPAS